MPESSDDSPLKELKLQAPFYSDVVALYSVPNLVLVVLEDLITSSCCWCNID